MGLEDEIREKLLRGTTPQQLIEEGYRKSTVYKVNGTIKAQTVPLSKRDWIIENFTFDQQRYLPGQLVPIGFTFTNTSPLDLYIHRIGVGAEWMGSSWVAQDVRELVKSGTHRWFSISLSLPRDMALGEYSVSFGVEGQYLPSSEVQPATTQWSDPIVMHVKKAFKGTSIFLSHSTEDMSLVRKLEQQLDNEGIRVVIAEYMAEPGILLEEKFQRMIRESAMLIALLTDSGLRSKWVMTEVDYATRMNKPMILLKEKGIHIDSKLEWVEFSKSDSLSETSTKVIQSIAQVQARIGGTAANQVAGLLVGAALLAFIGALLSESRR